MLERRLREERQLIKKTKRKRLEERSLMPIDTHNILYSITRHMTTCRLKRLACRLKRLESIESTCKHREDPGDPTQILERP